MGSRKRPRYSDRKQGDPCPVIMDDGKPCGTKVRTAGLCARHYTNHRKGKSLPTDRVKRSRKHPRYSDRKKGEPCPVIIDDGEPCGTKVMAAGLCAWHYQQHRRGEPFATYRVKRSRKHPRYSDRKKGEPCPVIMDDDKPCGTKVRHAGLCDRHYTNHRQGRAVCYGQGEAFASEAWRSMSCNHG